MDTLSELWVKIQRACPQALVTLSGLETNARPLARGELNSVRASGSSDLTSPVGEWIFFFFFFFFFFFYFFFFFFF